MLPNINQPQSTSCTITLTTPLLVLALGSAASQALPTFTAAAPLLVGALLVLLLGLLALAPPVEVNEQLHHFINS